MKTTPLSQCVWPYAALAEAAVAAAQHASVPTSAVAAPPVPNDVLGGGQATIEPWLRTTLATRGLRIRRVQATRERLIAALLSSAPAVVETCTGVLVVVGRRRQALVVITPTRQRRAVAVDDVALAIDDDGPALRERYASLFSSSSSPRQTSALLAALRGVEDRPPTAFGYLVEVPRAASTLTHLREHGAVTLLVGLLVAQLALMLLFFVESRALGGAVLVDGLHPAAVRLSALAAFSAIAFSLFRQHLQGRLATLVSSTLRHRVLAGALRLDHERVRSEGIGKAMGMALELHQLENVGLALVLSIFGVVIDVATSTALLLRGAVPMLALAAVVVGAAATAVVTLLSYRAQAQSTAARVALTDITVENMIGARTRKVQQLPSTWHEHEDAALLDALAATRQAHHVALLETSVVGRGFFLLALGVVFAGLAGGATAWDLAVTLMGVTLAASAMRQFTSGADELTQLLVSWRQLAPLFSAAARAEGPGDPALAAIFGARQQEHLAARAAELGLVDASSEGATGATSRQRPVLVARQIEVVAPDRRRTLLSGVDLVLHEGDQVLLTGPSGAGKSTLLRVVCGLQPPGSGALQLRGFDVATVGADTWRQRVAAVPQFHDNHIFAGTLAFNLLLGRQWPASDADLADAEAVCRELGLGPVLRRMPSGLRQMVGEGGWQLSHGEQSRVFMARALLQRADVLCFDESFGALDPATLRECLQVVRRRAPTLVVVAHP